MYINIHYRKKSETGLSRSFSKHDDQHVLWLFSHETHFRYSSNVI